MQLRRYILMSLVLCGLSRMTVCAKDLSPDEREFFEKRIRPVLVEYCYECHSPQAKTVQGNLYLHTREGLRQGGDSGAAVVPGKPTDGTLMESLRYETFEMPPSGKLSKRIIADFETWIKMGAPDPRSGPAVKAQPTIDLEAGRKFWAFVPPQRAELPDVQQQSHVVQPLDAFIQQKLEAENIQRSPLASREVLVRRLYYDLVGLPPTPAQIDRFVQDTRDDAYEQLVDELLASPAFGERWGRHWLDVARYADSTGGGRSRLYENSWRYRDYVIEAFNADKPYDQFIQEQIAGDLMPADSLEEEREQLVACGFLMLGPHNYELQDKELLRMEVVDEQVTTLGKAFLGMTIGCARCHDHKFDPIPTTDYYALAGIFRSTKSLGTGNVTNWMTRELPVPPKQQRRLQAHRQQVEQLNQQVTELNSQIKKLGGRTDLKRVRLDQLVGLVLDSEQENAGVKLTGAWKSSVSVPGYVRTDYRHDSNENKGEKKAVFTFELPDAGSYEVRVSYTANTNRATNVPITIWNGSEPVETATVDQRSRPPLEGGFTSLGTHTFTAAQSQDVQAIVEISTSGTNGIVIADAVQLIPAEQLKSHPQLANSSLKLPTQKTEEQAKQLAVLKTERDRLQQNLERLKKQGPEAPPEVMAVCEEAAEQVGDMELCIRGNIRNLGPLVPRGVLSVAAPPGDNVISSEFSGRLELAEWLTDTSNPLTARVMVNRVWAHLFGAGIVRTVDNFGSMGVTPSHPELLDHLSIEFMESGWSVKSLIRNIILSRTYRTSSQGTPMQFATDPENRYLSHFPKRRADAEYLRDSLLLISGLLEDDKGGPTVKSGSSEFEYVFTSRRRSVYLPVFRNKIEELLRVFNFPDPNLVQGQRTATTLATQALYLMNNSNMREFSEATAERVLQANHREHQNRIDRLYRLILGRRPTAAERQLCRRYLESLEAEHSEIDESDIWTSLCQTLFSSVDFRFIE